jgi:hypothetical protein
MNLFSVLTALALLGAECIARAQDTEVHTTDVCNSGELTLQVAHAYWEFKPLSFTNEHFWVVSRWVTVEPGDCERVFTHTYAASPLGLQHFPVHLAFAFTDSTGAWGPIKIESWRGPRDSAESTLELCVTKSDFSYRVEADDPAAACRDPENADGFLIPASIDYEPTRGNVFDNNGQLTPGPRFIVGVSRDARVSSSADSGPIGPGTTGEFIRLVGPAIEALPTSQDSAPAGYRDVLVCASRAVVERESLADPGTPRAQALAGTVAEYVGRYRGKLFFEIEELRSGFDITGLIGEISYCQRRGDRVFIFYAPDVH